MDGISLLDRIKQHSPNIPVIIMTAYSDLDRAVSAFQGGAYEYLSKPFDVDEVALELHWWECGRVLLCVCLRVLVRASCANHDTAFNTMAYKN